MSLEDRVRAATRARTALVYDTRPLELPDDLPAPARRWGTWLVPLAAAAVVVAIALTLVVVRQADAPRQGPPPAAPAAILATVPRYYAAITQDHSITHFTVVDDRAGKQFIDVASPGGANWEGVSAAADDRTFLLTLKDSWQWQVWVFHIFPGKKIPFSWQTIPIEPVAKDAYLNASLSPNGREVAVLSEAVTGKSTLTTTLQTYQASPSSKVPLRTWTASEQVAAGTTMNSSTVSWLSDSRHLAFSAEPPMTDSASAQPAKTEYAEEREIDTIAPSGDLSTASRVIFTGPQSNSTPCGTLSLTPDGGTVICGTQVAPGNGTSDPACGNLGPGLVAYPVRTGQPVRVLASYQQPCDAGTAVPLWSDSAAKDVIGVFSTSSGGSSQTQLRLAVDGRLYALPLPEKPVAGTAIAF
jgi:hypothetical protein